MYTCRQHRCPSLRDKEPREPASPPTDQEPGSGGGGAHPEGTAGGERESPGGGPVRGWPRQPSPWQHGHRPTETGQDWPTPSRGQRSNSVIQAECIM